MSKIATTTLNLSEYRMVDGFYVRNGFSLVQDKYCTETGEPIFVNKRANGKWGYCDNDGTDFYVDWIKPAVVGPFDHLPAFRPCSEGCGAMLLTTQIVPLCDMCGDYGEEGSTTNEEEDEAEEEDDEEEEDSDEEEEEDSEDEEEGVCDHCLTRAYRVEQLHDTQAGFVCDECLDNPFMCELVDCATCKRPTMRKDMYWKEGGCCMTDLCEPCHKAKIPDDMMVVPRYMFENEKGEKVKWCLCVMKL
jgi:hypothetical protein